MMVMFHDDDCGELLDGDGECPKCKFHPDAQSTGFKEVHNDILRLGIEGFGRTYLGEYRERINRIAKLDTTAPVPAASPVLTVVPTPPPLTEEEQLAALAALEEDIYLAFRGALKKIHDELIEHYTGDFTRASTLIRVLHATHAEEVGRYEKIIEEAHQRAGLPAPDVVKVRRERLARGRSRGRAT